MKITLTEKVVRDGHGVEGFACKFSLGDKQCVEAVSTKSCPSHVRRTHACHANPELSGVGPGDRRVDGMYRVDISEELSSTLELKVLKSRSEVPSPSEGKGWPHGRTREEVLEGMRR